MPRRPRLSTLALAFAVCAANLAHAGTRPKKPSQKTIGTDRLKSAHSIYIQNGPADSYFTNPNLIYQLFAADIKTWGRYTLAPTAAQADLVLQVVPTAFYDHVAPAKMNDYINALSVQVNLLDPASPGVIWSVEADFSMFNNTPKRVPAGVQSAVNQLKRAAGDK